MFGWVVAIIGMGYLMESTNIIHSHRYKIELRDRNYDRNVVIV